MAFNDPPKTLPTLAKTLPRGTWTLLNNPKTSFGMHLGTVISFDTSFKSDLRKRSQIQIFTVGFQECSREGPRWLQDAVLKLPIATHGLQWPAQDAPNTGQNASKRHLNPPKQPKDQLWNTQGRQETCFASQMRRDLLFDEIDLFLDLLKRSTLERNTVRSIVNTPHSRLEHILPKRTTASVAPHSKTIKYAHLIVVKQAAWDYFRLRILQHTHKHTHCMLLPQNSQCHHLKLRKRKTMSLPWDMRKGNSPLKNAMHVVQNKSVYDH